MTHQDNDWEIRSLQSQYKETMGIELTGHQAEKILLYEAEKSAGTSSFFSAWEELDYEQDQFQEILTPAQFEDYLSGKPARIKQIEESLIEHDKQYLPQLSAAEDRIVYYQETLIPALQKNLMLFSPVFYSVQEKIDFLKSEYKKHLAYSKKRMLVKHYRHSRTFQPTVLKIALLQHKQACLCPDYFSFKSKMDVPTKAVADYLLERLSAISENLLDALKDTLDQLKDFNTRNTAKHLGELRGWHTTLTIPNNIEELMLTILFDPGKYTC
ncbi:hypothetical protein SAMN04488505_103117 [Chitinophaga rupis]|uniref:Uncharacterized protein n=1 Tax=Chitinophaga rupis TaxID=573321 RepID=A0A1H7UW88_9BACT|nr:hypothetical protein [Chitinophaga rupis]SEM00737.1 hypothetical protein SAMN04488505_103117 [Chitinophaga rupis]